jgi:hypothetical protein
VAIVNVNGNSEPARMTAFVEAIAAKREVKETRQAGDKKLGKGAPKFDNAAAAAEIAAQLAKLRRPDGKSEGPGADVKALVRADR